MGKDRSVPSGAVESAEPPHQEYSSTKVSNVAPRRLVRPVCDKFHPLSIEGHGSQARCIRGTGHDVDGEFVLAFDH